MALAVSLAAAARRALLLRPGCWQALRMPPSLHPSFTLESSSLSSSFASRFSPSSSPRPRPPPPPPTPAAAATAAAAAAPASTVAQALPSPPATNLAARAALSVDPAVLAKARRLSLPVGVAAGVFGSVVGVGGGTLIVPFFSSTCPAIPQRLLSGTSLAAVVATAAAATPAYVSAGAVDAAAAAAVGGAALLAVRAGAGAALAARPRALRTALGAFLLVAAVLVPARTALLTLRGAGDEEGGRGGGEEEGAASASDAASPVSSSSSLPPAAAAAAAAPASLLDAPGRTAALLATGAAAGFASGLLGIGGGILVTPALALLGGLRPSEAGGSGGGGGGGGGESASSAAAAAAASASASTTTTSTSTTTTTTAPSTASTKTTPERRDFRSAQALVVGTSLAAMAPPAALALAAHAAARNVDWKMALGLAAGSLLGSLLGSRTAVAAPPGYLEAAFSVAMVGLGLNALKVAKRI